jgi:hypothetical protein
MNGYESTISTHTFVGKQCATMTRTNKSDTNSANDRRHTIEVAPRLRETCSNDRRQVRAANSSRLPVRVDDATRTDAFANYSSCPIFSLREDNQTIAEMLPSPVNDALRDRTTQTVNVQLEEILSRLSSASRSAFVNTADGRRTSRTLPYKIVE